MTADQGEGALAEIIGFLLILGLITVGLALYLVYGVPALGRENEIAHMGLVNDQFVEYKISLDSLFTNNQVGDSVSNSFSLGTGGGYLQGSNSIFPIMNPMRSTGKFLINRRTTIPETLTITSRSYVMDTGNTSVALPAQVNYTPNHVYVNISIPSSVPLNITGNYGLTVNTSKWIATVNLTPQSTYYIDFKPLYNTNPCPLTPNGTGILARLINPAGGAEQTGCLLPVNQSRYAGTDLKISITKDNVITMQNYPVSNNVVSGGKYTVDLMDGAYGLNPVTLPGDYISLEVDQRLGSIVGNGNITYDFSEKNPYTITPIPLGSIEDRAENNYWISQNYYYQMGGVFLSQTDGNTSYKLPPEITFSYNPSSKISTVNISALAITTNQPGGSAVGGNSPVQIETTLTKIYPMPYAVGTANTKWIRIGFNTSDDQARVMWMNYFNYTAMAAGLPNTFTGTTTTESYIFINGSDTTATKNFDINVIASNATYLAMVYGGGG